MRIEDRTRFEVLLEDIQTSVRLIAEGHGALNHRFEQMETRFDARFERLETKVDVLEVLATDAQRRLERIEAHLELNGASARPTGRADKAPKPRRKA